MEESDLFTINYGNFEDELNLFDLAIPGEIRTSMTMRDGFFYIANGESRKVMGLTSYGDLLTLYYNPESMLNVEFAAENSGNSTKKAVAYPFNEIGAVAVDSRKGLYVVDTLPEERQERDEERRLLLSQVVLRFDPDGNFIDYIGQQGPGGTPFALVKGIYTTEGDELVVVTVSDDGFDVFWFGSNGFLLYQVPVRTSSIPVPAEDGEASSDIRVSVENVVPDPNSYALYVKADSYRTLVDPDIRVQSGIAFHRTSLIPLDVDSGEFGQPLDIPSYEYVVSEGGGVGQEAFEVSYDLLGVTKSGWFFFIARTDDGYMVQMLNPDGQQSVKRRIAVDHSRVLYHVLSLSDTGILSGLFVRRENAEVAWWRTDSLLDSFIAN